MGLLEVAEHGGEVDAEDRICGGKLGAAGHPLARLVQVALLEGDHPQEVGRVGVAGGSAQVPHQLRPGFDEPPFVPQPQCVL